MVRPPVHIDRFFGRTRELLELERLFGPHRMVTITGSPGCGKSRLAAEFAARSRYPCGVMWFDATVRDQVEALRRLAGARPIGHQLQLLVLDDADADVVELSRTVRQLRHVHRQIDVLITSREPLRISGEYVLRIDDLPHAPNRRTGGQSPAAELFEDRARAVNPEFAITDANASAVATLCTRLDGNPLALELSARLTRVFRPDKLAKALDDKLGLLTSGLRSGRPRHRTLRSALDASHRLLGKDEQILLRRLTVLSGGFGTTEAAAVCADLPDIVSRADQLLSRLHEKSLLKRTGEYRMSEAMREYAAERLRRAGDEQAAMDNLVDWLALLVADLPATVAPPSALLHTLTRRVDDLTRAEQWAAENGDPRATLLAAALVTALLTRQDYTRAAQVAREKIAEESTALLHVQAAIAERCRGDHDTALRHAEKAAALAEQDDKAMHAAALLEMGSARTRRHEYAAAETLLARAVHLCGVLGQPSGVANGWERLALLALEREDFGTAALVITQAKATYQEMNDEWALFRVLHLAGDIALRCGDTATAEELFTEGVRLAGDSRRVHLMLDGLAAVAAARGDHQRALRLASGAAAIRGGTATTASAGWQTRLTAALTAAGEAVDPAERSAIEHSARQLTVRQLVDFALENRWPLDATVSALTTRQHRIIRLLADGRTNNQIARLCGVSARTVVYELSHVRTALGLRSRTELAAWTRRHLRMPPS